MKDKTLREQIEALSSSETERLSKQLVISLDEADLLELLKDFRGENTPPLIEAQTYMRLYSPEILEDYRQGNLEAIIDNQIRLEDTFNRLIAAGQMTDVFNLVADFCRMVLYQFNLCIDEFLSYEVQSLTQHVFTSLYKCLGNSDEAARSAFYRVLIENMDHSSELELALCAEHVYQILEHNFGEEFTQALNRAHQAFEASGSPFWQFSRKNFLVTEYLFMTDQFHPNNKKSGFQNQIWNVKFRNS